MVISTDMENESFERNWKAVRLEGANIICHACCSGQQLQLTSQPEQADDRILRNPTAAKERSEQLH